MAGRPQSTSSKKKKKAGRRRVAGGRVPKGLSKTVAKRKAAGKKLWVAYSVDPSDETHLLGVYKGRAKADEALGAARREWSGQLRKGLELVLVYAPLVTTRRVADTKNDYYVLFVSREPRGIEVITVSTSHEAAKDAAWVEATNFGGDYDEEMVITDRGSAYFASAADGLIRPEIFVQRTTTSNPKKNPAHKLTKTPSADELAAVIRAQTGKGGPGGVPVSAELTTLEVGYALAGAGYYPQMPESIRYGEGEFFWEWVRENTDREQLEKLMEKHGYRLADDQFWAKGEAPPSSGELWHLEKDDRLTGFRLWRAYLPGVWPQGVTVTVSGLPNRRWPDGTIEVAKYTIFVGDDEYMPYGWGDFTTPEAAFRAGEAGPHAVPKGNPAGEYLALYTGQGGPISAVLLADSADEASELAAGEDGAQWINDFEDALGLDVGASQQAIDLAVQAGGWRLVRPAAAGRPFAIWERGARPRMM